MQTRIVSLIAVISLCLSGCSSLVTLAPGAVDLKVTKNASDVTACTSVGNVDGRPYDDPTNGADQMRNEATGLGGDTLFEPPNTTPESPIAVEKVLPVASSASLWRW